MVITSDQRSLILPKVNFTGRPKTSITLTSSVTSKFSFFTFSNPSRNNSLLDTCGVWISHRLALGIVRNTNWPNNNDDGDDDEDHIDDDDDDNNKEDDDDNNEDEGHDDENDVHDDDYLSKDSMII